ncbi:MAG: hypothetical protein PHD95_06045 [Candidatus ainarchaeum sp.]|nr:hypothetical protein [Candidatus ainarchaeum sp.]
MKLNNLQKALLRQLVIAQREEYRWLHLAMQTELELKTEGFNIVIHTEMDKAKLDRTGKKLLMLDGQFVHEMHKAGDLADSLEVKCKQQGIPEDFIFSVKLNV